MPCVVIYARYSSDKQRDASIEDQVAVCRRYADRQGWTVVDWYADRAISGASLLRPGIQSLMDDAGIFKRLSFAGVKIVTLSEGEISPLHVGLKGTMNALFLKGLADKTQWLAGPD